MNGQSNGMIWNPTQFGQRKELYRMKKALRAGTAMLVGILCMMVFSAQGAPEVQHASGTSNESVAFATGTVAGGKLFLFERNEGEYYAISANGEVLTAPCIPVHETPGPEQTDMIPMALAAEGDAVFALNAVIPSNSDSTMGMRISLYRLNANAELESKVCDLDLSDAIQLDSQAAHFPVCRSALKRGNELFLLFDLEAAVDVAQSESAVMICHLDSGNIQRIDQRGILQMIAYEEGDLICAQAVSQSNDVQLLRLNPSSGEAKVIYRLKGETGGGGRPQNIVANVANGQMFYTINNQVWGLRTQKDVPKQIAELSVWEPAGMFQLNQNLMCVFSDQKVQIFPVDWDFTLENRQLKVYGGCGWLSDYAQSHQELEIEEIHIEPSDEIIQAVLAGSSTPDLFCVSSHYPVYSALKEKGMLLPLEDRLQKYAQQLHPDIRAAISVNGTACALPMELLIHGALGVNETLWNERNLGEIPTNWPDFIAFLRAWPEQSQSNPDICLFYAMDAEIICVNLRSQAIEDYESYRQIYVPDSGYDTKVFRELMNSLDALDYEKLSASQEFSNANQILLMVGYSPSLSFEFKPFRAMPLAVTQEVSAVQRTTLFVLAVNSLSQNEEVLLPFLNYALDHNDAISQLEMQAGESDLPEAAQSVPGLTEALQSVSPESLHRYRLATERLCIEDHARGLIREAIGRLRIAYITGEIDLETFIADANCVLQDSA